MNMPVQHHIILLCSNLLLYIHEVTWCPALLQYFAWACLGCACTTEVMRCRGQSCLHATVSLHGIYCCCTNSVSLLPAPAYTALSPCTVPNAHARQTAGRASWSLLHLPRPSQLVHWPQHLNGLLHYENLFGFGGRHVGNSMFFCL